MREVELGMRPPPPEPAIPSGSFAAGVETSRKRGAFVFLSLLVHSFLSVCPDCERESEKEN